MAKTSTKSIPTTCTVIASTMILSLSRRHRVRSKLTQKATNRARLVSYRTSSATTAPTSLHNSTAPLVHISTVCWSTSQPISKITTLPPPNGTAHAYTSQYLVRNHHRQVRHFSLRVDEIIRLLTGQIRQVPCGVVQW
jgi:hypothetical protein